MSDEDERTDQGDGEPGEATDDAPERDPFGLLEETAGDREGDPFDTLGDPDADEGVGPGVESQTATGADTAADDRTADAPSSEGEKAGEKAGENEGETADEGIQEVSEPQVRPGAPSVGGSGADAEASGIDRGDPFADESAFEEMDVGAIDEDEVWREISDAQARGSVRDAGKRDYAEVDKHRYCERCEHFTEPPAVRCTHEGTEILEFVDNDTVRLADCPIVAQRRALQRGAESE